MTLAADVAAVEDRLSNYPRDIRYPTRAQISREAMADSILARQEKAEAAWLKAVPLARETLARLLADMPLGCRIHGYDAKDILATLDDWMHIQPGAYDEWRAQDMAEEY